MKKRSSYINRLIAGFSSINFVYLAALYILAYLAVEILVSDPIRHYNFCVFLALSGIYFSWFIGGRRTMAYVAFFNILFAGIFSKILWDQGIIIYGGGLFLGKSFLGMYALTVVLLFIMLLKKSPADIRAEYQKNTIEQERAHRQNLEFMVATRKLTQDMVAQANMVKDELQLIEGAWKSNVHSIINDLSPVKEEELYRQIILPFQENIIRHLRNLETGLTFDLQPLALTDLYTFLTQKTTGHAAAIEQARQSWQHCAENVVVDKNKIWDMVKNILRNSQAALDLQRLHQLDADPAALTTPRISI
ncbi:MAG: histidine kinase, partial [Deltaproteobacteria bacterium]|nr:histidine kinase [Deltaproteobacteria bacterium]